MPIEDWNSLFDELASTRFLHHNDDYLEFLVEKVWKFTEPMNIVDFGCGFGYMGLKILPLLPFGCKYTGIDMAGNLIEKGRELYAETSFDFDFIQAARLEPVRQSQTYSIPDGCWM